MDDADHLRDVLNGMQVAVEDHWGLGKLQMETFEALVEGRWNNRPVSPSTRQKSLRWPVATIKIQTSPTVLSCSLGPGVCQRLFELNDPVDQADVFRLRRILSLRAITKPCNLIRTTLPP